MNQALLKNNLIASLTRMYEMEVFSCLTEFLQGEHHVLLYLLINPDKEINPSTLSKNLYVSRSRITAALSTLRKKGYVSMEMSSRDRRKMCVMLTKEGKAFIKEKQKKAQRYFEVLMEGLGEENTQELIRLIELCIRTMEHKEKWI